MNRGFRVSGFGNARRSIEKMARDKVCEKCGGIGFVIDPTRRPHMDMPCPACQQISVTLRGKEYKVKSYFIAGPDRSVGLMSEWLDEFELEGVSDDFYESLTDEEVSQVEAAIFAATNN